MGPEPVLLLFYLISISSAQVSPCFPEMIAIIAATRVKGADCVGNFNALVLAGHIVTVQE